MDSSSTINDQLAKVISMWAVIGITSWAEFASFIAAVYTLLLMGEWMYKKLFKKKV